MAYGKLLLVTVIRILVAADAEITLQTLYVTTHEKQKRIYAKSGFSLSLPC